MNVVGFGCLDIYRLKELKYCYTFTYHKREMVFNCRIACYCT